MPGGIFSLRPEPKLLQLPMPVVSAPSGMPGPPGQAASLIGTFHDTFKNIMGEVNRQQFHADEQARAFAAGDVEDIHDVAMAINKAKFSLDLTVKVRDKLLEAYRELSAMR